MIKIDTIYVRYVLPGIILQGGRKDLMEKMRDPEYIKKISMPESCLFDKFDLIPLDVAEIYFKKLGLYSGQEIGH